VGKVVWALFLEERDKTEEIWVDVSTRLVLDIPKSRRPVESLSLDLEALDRLIFYSAYGLHDSTTFGTCERIGLPG